MPSASQNPAPPPGVTVCIPAYRGGDALYRAIQSARQQRHRRLRILVSLDDSNRDETGMRLCRQLQHDDARIQLFEQPTRLGWVGNTNFLLDRVDSEFFCLLFQDDRQHPDYVSACLIRFAQDPGAVSVSGDLQLFGSSNATVAGHDYLGDPLHRALSYLGVQRHSFALRCLTRRGVLDRGTRLEHNDYDGYFANHAFALELLLAGRCLHTPNARYFKAVHDDSVTAGWRAWSPTTTLAAWDAHRRDCERVLERSVLPADTREQLALCLDLRHLARIREHQCHHGGATRPVPGTTAADATVQRFRPDCRTLVRQLLARLLYFEGVLARRDGRHASAVRLLEQSLELNPQHTGARQALDGTLREAGEVRPT